MRDYVPFRRRRIESLGLRSVAGTTLKHYAVIAGRGRFERSRFESAKGLVRAALPRPSRVLGRPGAGLLIHHQGFGVYYVVLAWWDRENELPMRVWVQDHGRWRKARDGESVCVWDLEIVWFERQAWIKHVLNGQRVAPGVKAYLQVWCPVSTRK